MLLALLMRAGDEAPGRGGRGASRRARRGVLGRLALAGRMRWVAQRARGPARARSSSTSRTCRSSRRPRSPRTRTTRAASRDAAARSSAARSSRRDGVVLAESVPDRARVPRATYPGGRRSRRTSSATTARATAGRASRRPRTTTLAGQAAVRARSQDVIDDGRGQPGARQRRRAHHRLARAARGAGGARGQPRRVRRARPAHGRRARAGVATRPTTRRRSTREWEPLSAAGERRAARRTARRARCTRPARRSRSSRSPARSPNGVATPETDVPRPGVARRSAAARSPTSRAATSARSTLREATAQSINTVFAQLAAKLGPQALVAQARRASASTRRRRSSCRVRDLAHDRPEAHDHVGDRVGGRRPAGRRRGRIPRSGPSATPLADGARRRGHRRATAPCLRPYVIDRIADASGTVLSRHAAARRGRQATRRRARRRPSATSWSAS